MDPARPAPQPHMPASQAGAAVAVPPTPTQLTITPRNPCTSDPVGLGVTLCGSSRKPFRVLEHGDYLLLKEKTFRLKHVKELS